MEWMVVFGQVVTLFLLMVVGLLARKTKILTPSIVKGFTELLTVIVLPFQIIASFTFESSPEMLLNGGIVFVVAIAIHLLAMLLSELLYRGYPASTGVVLRFVTVFSNCGFMGFPVLESLFGSRGVFYGSFYVVAFNLFIWTVGVSYFTKGKGASKITELVRNPGIAAVIIGLLLFLSPLKLPDPIIQVFKVIGSMNTPLSMLIIGSVLAEISLTTLFTEVSAYYVSLVRLFFFPVMVLLILRLLKLPSILSQVLAILTAMPAAALTTVFAEKYDGDTVLASQSVFLTTILSIVTIPLIVFLLQVFGLAT